MDLSRFVRVHPRGLPRWWPQGEIGVILWGLSAVAKDWQNAAALTALCTIPDDELPETRRGAASTMFVWRILWPLRWFGLLEYRGPEEARERGMAQERPVRPLPVVRCPAIGQPRIEPLRGPVLVREQHAGECLRLHRTIRNRYAVDQRNGCRSRTDLKNSL